jgi:hypothetical protein
LINPAWRQVSGYLSFGPSLALLDAAVPFGRRYCWKTDNFDVVDKGLSEALVASAGKISSPFSAILLMHLDGVPGKVEPIARSPWQ